LAVGSGPLALAGVDVRVEEWSEEFESAHASSFDVGIMPLSDGPWERGKCGYKLIQYMAAGVATVASPIGVNASIVDHEKTGFHAESTEQWVSALRQLRDDHFLRNRMGAQGRKKVERKYTVEVVAPTLLSAFESIALSRRQSQP
jgi:glycosyltransferase involved in cell wall biosynthesis